MTWANYSKLTTLRNNNTLGRLHMRSVKLTTTVIRGILALGKPGINEALHYTLTPQELKRKGLSKVDIDAANKALDWAASVSAGLQSKPPKKEPTYNDLVIPDFD
tara:strand:- start:485 stop:799 length:315 start_codon:yes stop_codon:yes gene_type:complete